MDGIYIYLGQEGDLMVTLKNGVKGLSKLIKGDIPQGSIVLVTGAPGTLKSGFVYAILQNYLSKTGKYGLYITLEQSRESLLINMKSLGIGGDRGIEVVDFSDIREKFREVEKRINMLRLINGLLDFFENKEKKKITCFALDSLSALLPLLGEVDLRSEIFHLFQILRKRCETSFILCETPSVQQLPEYTPEYFLGDGIIELGITKIGKRYGRYIQILKMRGTSHKIDRYEIRVGSSGIEILNPI
jgi:KaiC/GvpD/RAD55 family RecA-like ATPase